MGQNEIEFMTRFGGVNIDWSAVTGLRELPKEMQVTDEDVSDSATYANFICYCDRNKIKLEYTTGLSGFTSEQVAEVIVDAKRLGIYDELADNFRKPS